MSSSDRRRRHARRLSRSGRNTIMLPIDFYFDFASPYGFLAAMQIDALAERAGRTVRWRPFLLGAVYKQVEQSPLDHPPKRDYVNNVDAPRCARLLALTLQRPRGWPEHALPPSRIFYWLDRDDPARAADYARAAYRKYWPSGESTADPDAAADVAAALGHKHAIKPRPL
jgi:2-hydroxychromene-2-carboxylate isomerase